MSVTGLQSSFLVLSLSDFGIEDIVALFKWVKKYSFYLFSGNLLKMGIIFWFKKIGIT